MKPWILWITGLMMLSSVMGCTLADVNVEVVSERTALENQVLGTYNSLDTEMLLVASVRGVDPGGQIQRPPEHTKDHEDAIAAMQVLAFHSDDIQAFKQLGWVGENTDGLLTAFAMDKTNPPEPLADFANRYTQEEFDAVIRQCNEARETIMKRVIETNENLTRENLPEVRRIFWKMNVENALPGEKIQTEDGQWTVK